MTTVFLTFATDKFISNARSLAESAARVGFDKAKVLTPADIQDSDFFRNNRATFALSRGYGNWLWKPLIIRNELAELKNSDVLHYCDAGRTRYYNYTKFPLHLVERTEAEKNGFIVGTAIGHLGPVSQWTKRDCLVLMDADRPEYVEKPIVQATWSLWRNTQEAMKFLDEWLNTCSDRRCLTDDANVCGLPNYDNFTDHRHDQSILSILTYKHNALYLDFSSTIVDRIIRTRPKSALSNYFYKRPQNADELLIRDRPLMLIREYKNLAKITKIQGPAVIGN